MKLFSGTANPALSEKVSKLLDIPLSKSEVVRFGNSEVRVRIEDDVKNETCVVIQPTSNPTDSNLMEFFLFCDALRRGEAKKVIGVMPYFGYARQDIQHRPGECVSANVVIRFLESIGFAKIYTIDLHDEATEGVFSIPFKNLSTMLLLAKKVGEYLVKIGVKNVDPDHVVVVSPDQGAIEKVRGFGTHLFGTENFSLAMIEKKRDQDLIHKAKPMDMYGNVEGKVAIIVDDMVVSGSTIFPAIDLCLSRGATKVIAAFAHHDFAFDAPQKLQNSKLEKVFSTDTILLSPGKKFDKLEEVSVAPLITNALKYLV